VEEAQGLHLQAPNTSHCVFAQAAENLIALVPSLLSLVERSVAEVHLLSAEANYDISHSEPHWRSRIFVSTPERTDSIGALRFAESIIHEAMHLNLTNTEDITPLVSDFQSQMPSPWRAEARSIQGIMHGLFVFTCLTAFFRRILEAEFDQHACRAHIHTRLSEIQSQMALLDLMGLTPGLTARGAKLAARWHALAFEIDGA